MKFGIKGCNSNFHQLQDIPMEFLHAAGSTQAKNSKNTHILMNCQPGLNVTSILNRRSQERSHFQVHAISSPWIAGTPWVTLAKKKECHLELPREWAKKGEEEGTPAICCGRKKPFSHDKDYLLWGKVTWAKVSRVNLVSDSITTGQIKWTSA